MTQRDINATSGEAILSAVDYVLKYAKSIDALQCAGISYDQVQEDRERAIFAVDQSIQALRRELRS